MAKKSKKVEWSPDRCPVCDSWDYRKKYDQCFTCGAWFAAIKSHLYNNSRQMWYKFRKLGLL